MSATRAPRRRTRAATKPSPANAVPFSLEAEEFVLGGILERPATVAAVAAMLEPEDFFLPSHAQLFRAILAIHERGELVDPPLLLAELPRIGGLDLHEAGRLLPVLAGTVVDPANTPRHAGIVQELAARRRRIEATEAFARAERNGGATPVQLEELQAVLAGPKPAADRTFHPEPLDWSKLTSAGLPTVEYVGEDPYLPASGRVWSSGPAAAGKSMWSQHRSSRLSRMGVAVAYWSQENPLVEDVRRLERLRPDWRHLRFFHDQGVDLAQPDHVAAVIRACEGCQLITFDTLTACWSGDENDNAAIAQLDREALIPIVRDTGACVVMLDHTGHPQPFVARRGSSAARGASSKGQKADSTLEFKVEGQGQFSIVHGKARIGGVQLPTATFKVVDTEDGGLDVIEITTPWATRVEELAATLVEAIEAAGHLTVRGVREAAKGLGGKDLVRDAMTLLEGEDPPRVTVGWETVQTEKGRQRAKVWRCGAGVADTMQPRLEES